MAPPLIVIARGFCSVMSMVAQTVLAQLAASNHFPSGAEEPTIIGFAVEGKGPVDSGALKS